MAHNVNNTLTGILGRAQPFCGRTTRKISAGIEMIKAPSGAHIIRHSGFCPQAAEPEV